MQLHKFAKVLNVVDNKKIQMLRYFLSKITFFNSHLGGKRYIHLTAY